MTYQWQGPCFSVLCNSKVNKEMVNTHCQMNKWTRYFRAHSVHWAYCMGASVRRNTPVWEQVLGRSLHLQGELICSLPPNSDTEFGIELKLTKRFAKMFLFFLNKHLVNQENCGCIPFSCWLWFSKKAYSWVLLSSWCVLAFSKFYIMIFLKQNRCLSF